MVIVLDDWLDGTGRTPDQVLARLQETKGGDDSGMSGMSGMDHGSTGGMGMMDGESPLLGGAGDVSYPYALVNGRTPDAPDPRDQGRRGVGTFHPAIPPQGIRD